MQPEVVPGQVLICGCFDARIMISSHSSQFHVQPPIRTHEGGLRESAKPFLSNGANDPRGSLTMSRRVGAVAHPGSYQFTSP